MRKLINFTLISLDGFFEGENHDLSWHNVDQEFNEFAIQQLHETDTLLFGRKTYQLMESFWPTAQLTDPLDTIVAERMNNLPKVVVSHSLTEVVEQPNWKNITLVRENIIEEVKKLKEHEGKYISLFASNNLMVHLAEAGLIDEYRVLLNPVVIGKGTHFFEGNKQKFSLQLTNTRTFHNGNILLQYIPNK